MLLFSSGDNFNFHSSFSQFVQSWQKLLYSKGLDLMQEIITSSMPNQLSYADICL